MQVNIFPIDEPDFFIFIVNNKINKNVESIEADHVAEDDYRLALFLGSSKQQAD